MSIYRIQDVIRSWLRSSPPEGIYRTQYLCALFTAHAQNKLFIMAYNARCKHSVEAHRQLALSSYGLSLPPVPQSSATYVHRHLKKHGAWSVLLALRDLFLIGFYRLITISHWLRSNNEIRATHHASNHVKLPSIILRLPESPPLKAINLNDDILQPPDTHRVLTWP